MRKSLPILLLFSLISILSLRAQQDPMFTKYMFNSLAYNPGFAGAPEYMQIRLLYRNQWWGFEGAPKTQTLTIHAPVNDRIGLGLNLVNDDIGATGTTALNFAYAYRFQFGAGKLSLGLQGGILNWRADWNDPGLKFRDPKAQDEAYAETNPVRWMPNVGAGVYYTAPKFYVGFSVPHLINWDLRRESEAYPITTDKWARLYRHYFLTAGAALPIDGDALIFKPSILIKSVGLLSSFTTSGSTINAVGAPNEFDLDLSFLFHESLWIGASWRTAFEADIFGGESSMDSADVWMSIYLSNGLRIGASYDYSLTKIQEFTKGSFEIMLGYDFSFNIKRINTPRYF